MAWRPEVVHHMVIDLDEQTLTLDGEEWTVLVDHVTVIDLNTPPL